MEINYLDTGDTGHAVSADSDGALFAGIIGSEKYVLKNGSQFNAEVQSNNIVKISDGDLVMYGRHVRIPANNSALVTINNGHSGTNRIDLIAFRYTKDSTGKETVYLVVIQGEYSTGTPTAPTAIDGNILIGAMQSDFPLYAVTLNGINITKVEKLFKTVETNDTLTQKVNELNSALLDKVYPINSIYMSTSSTNPKELFGGTWVAWGTGRVPIGVNTSDGNFNTVEKTGGSKTVNSSHVHGLRDARAGVGRSSTDVNTISYVNGGNPHNVVYDRRLNVAPGITGGSFAAMDTAKIYGNTDSGGSTALSILPPYITCYMWKRTA